MHTTCKLYTSVSNFSDVCPFLATNYNNNFCFIVALLSINHSLGGLRVEIKMYTAVSYIYKCVMMINKSNLYHVDC